MRTFLRGWWAPESLSDSKHWKWQCLTSTRQGQLETYGDASNGNPTWPTTAAMRTFSFAQLDIVSLVWPGEESLPTCATAASSPQAAGRRGARLRHLEHGAQSLPRHILPSITRPGCISMAGSSAEYTQSQSVCPGLQTMCR